ncbi:MAG: hypothetical protein ABSC37_09085 [Xanthobacteraceae bacterium]|jgi:hypothetical protein
MNALQQNETLAQFLERRERELLARVSALRGQLDPAEAELAQIQKVRGLLSVAREAGRTDLASDAPIGPNPFAQMTIKELVVQAILDHFPTGGTAAQIRDFIRDAYGRTIEPSSLRPQMHRLKGDAVLTHDPSTDTWNLTPEKRCQYSMYNHPSSRKAMTELRDDEISENEPRTRLREVEAPKTEQIKRRRI